MIVSDWLNWWLLVLIRVGSVFIGLCWWLVGCSCLFCCRLIGIIW